MIMFMIMRKITMIIRMMMMMMMMNDDDFFHHCHFHRHQFSSLSSLSSSFYKKNLIC
jgi:hypothetical protein